MSFLFVYINYNWSYICDSLPAICYAVIYPNVQSTKERCAGQFKKKFNFSTDDYVFEHFWAKEKHFINKIVCDFNAKSIEQWRIFLFRCKIRFGLTIPLAAVLCEQGIIEWTGTETFAKEPKLARLLRVLESTPVMYNNKSYWFFPHVCNGKFSEFWVLAAG